MSGVGRNEPCPCGSGRKYKRCCLGEGLPADDRQTVKAPEVEADLELLEHLRDVEGKVWTDVEEWAALEAPEFLTRALEACPLDTDTHPDLDHFAQQFVSTIAAPMGSTLLTRFRRTGATETTELEQAWMDTIEAGWLSLWQVQAVRPGRGFDLRDLLTGEERSVVEPRLSKEDMLNDVLCARVVDAAGISLLAGFYPAALTTSEAAEAAKSFREAVDHRTDLFLPSQLRGSTAGELLRSWDAVVQELRLAEFPLIRSAEGDPIQFTIDLFFFETWRRGEILALLRAMEELRAEPDEPGLLSTESIFTVALPADPTVFCELRLSRRTLELETSSEQRSDEMIVRLQGVLGDRVTSPYRMPDTADDVPSEEYLPDGDEETEPHDLGMCTDVRAVMLEAKIEHYENWPDTPMPLLTGRTPRECLHDPVLRSLVRAALYDMEDQEALAPEDERYDVDLIWRALGLDPSR